MSDGFPLSEALPPPRKRTLDAVKLAHANAPFERAADRCVPLYLLGPHGLMYDRDRDYYYHHHRGAEFHGPGFDVEVGR